MTTTLQHLQVLHVEDDPVQRALIARLLRDLPDFEVEIVQVEGEDEAVDRFVERNFSLVIVDYNLTQGNGLSCLRKIRVLDPIVPVIAVSGVATAEIAAQLIGMGADDYLGKRTINGAILGQSVRNVIMRANAFKSRFAGSQFARTQA